MRSSDGDRQVCVCVFVATIASQVNFQNDALMPSLINLIKRCSRNRQVCYAWVSSACGCTFVDRRCPGATGACYKCLKQMLTSSWNSCIRTCTVLQMSIRRKSILERHPLRDSVVTPWLSPIRFPAHYSHLYPQSVNPPTLQSSKLFSASAGDA